MKFISIAKEDIGIQQTIFQSYTTSFPEDERRDNIQFLELFSHPAVKVFSIEVGADAIGYLITWMLNDVVFIEHFEVFEAFRNKKYGSQILQDFSKMFPRLVLESEPSDLNDLAARRIAFYQRNHFEIIDTDYLQPAYSTGKNSLHLFLLSNCKIDKTNDLVNEIHATVYANLK